MGFKSDYKIGFARITSGQLYEHLKDIDIFGRLDKSGEFIIFGCKEEDEPRFYKGILEYDKITQVHGFETVEEVEEWWECPDMMLHIEKGEFEVVKFESIPTKAKD